MFRVKNVCIKGNAIEFTDSSGDRKVVLVADKIKNIEIKKEVIVIDEVKYKMTDKKYANKLYRAIFEKIHGDSDTLQLLLEDENEE